MLSGFSRKCEIKGEKLITCRWQLIRLKRTSFTAQLPAFIGGIQGPPWKNVSFVVNKKSISVHFENPGKEMGPRGLRQTNKSVGNQNKIEHNEQIDLG